MSRIRNCSPEDMPTVAKLFQKIFRDFSKPSHPSLESYLSELFLKIPITMKSCHLVFTSRITVK